MMKANEKGEAETKVVDSVPVLSYFRFTLQLVMRPPAKHLQCYKLCFCVW